MDMLQLADALETCIITNTGGWANGRALARFNKVAQALEAKLDTGEEQRRIGELCVWAELLFSTQRHRRWERGVSQLRQMILAELAELRAGLS